MSYYNQIHQLAKAQAHFDNMAPPDDEEDIIDPDEEPDFESMLEAKQRN